MAFLQRIPMIIAASALALLLAIFLPKFFNRHEFDDVATISYDNLLQEHYIMDDMLLKSMTEFGFFYLQGVPNYNASDELRLLQRFFDLPEATKMKVAIKRSNPINDNVYRGYELRDIETQYKEMFNLGRFEEDSPPQTNGGELGEIERGKLISTERNYWPSTDDPKFDAEFRRVFQSGLKIRWSIARSIVKSFGRSLGHPELIDQFEHAEFSTMGLRKYPVRTNSSDDMKSPTDGKILTELEHIDGTFTILSTFSNAGLQALYKDKFLDVPPSENGFLVNIGSSLSEITDNRIKAVRHRVINLGKPRYSIPFFFNPSFDADISRSISGHVTTAGKAGYSTFGGWMVDHFLPSVELGLYTVPGLWPSKETD